MRIYSLICCLCLLFANTAFASEAGGHADPVAPVLLALVVILVVAKAGSEIFERFGQPAVLGELLGGVVIGNLILLNPVWNFFEPLRAAHIEEHWAVVIDSLARIGVIILLFEVGLESTVPGMMKVGASSLWVAVLGVITPFFLGFGVSWLFIKELPAELAATVPAEFSLNYVHMFIGAVLCATSVGITARVFKDLGKLQLKEAQIILGAAVIDDVLGLIILAVVSGIITAAELGQPLAIGALLRLIGVAILFLGGALLLGVAAGLTIAAIIGKQICGLGVVEKGLDRITVGVGMIPRGEVGLIFASIGKGLKVIDDATFSAVVIMVIVTTLVTPPVLKLTLARGEKNNCRLAVRGVEIS